jgi:crossover junction endodeoxyribonuclease RuvC
MIILGIDPGSRTTGYGLIRQEGNRLIHVDNGAIFTKSDQPLPDRLKVIYDGLADVIARYQPEEMAIEDIFVAKNASSALKLGHARGTAMVVGVNNALPVAEYTAMQVKSAVVGYGHANKNQVQKMVKTLLNLPEIAQEDASDALAVAICHANSRLMRSHQIAAASSVKQVRGRRR